MDRFGRVGALGAAALLAATTAMASDYGSFDGYTLRVKLIGGAQYEPLYTLIPQWEEATGATVEILSRRISRRATSTIACSRTTPTSRRSTT